MASLSFTSVGKRFPDGTLALSRVDLEVRDGEFLVLVGPSGCGKSTLLRSAAGLETLSEGKIAIGGKDVTDLGPGDRDIAMVFQNYALYPHMDVYENMAFGLGQRKVPKDVIKQKVEEAARILDLMPYIRKRPGTLSGGQRQRVAMGRAIVRDPQCFLMDEPLSNLDAKLRVQMRAELKLLNARLGVTTLYVTHDQVEAMTMGDRVAVLRPVSDENESNLQQCANPRELYEKPVNLFVAGFIGSPAMNFFTVRPARNGETINCAIAGTDMVLPLTAAQEAARPFLAQWTDRDLILGVRPEAFLYPNPIAGGLKSKVLITEMTGADAYAFFDNPGTKNTGSLLSASRITARIDPRHLPKADEEIHIGVDMDRAHFFDPATGLALR
ncbi:ATP-binding cassette domain-containing protein [Nordella sp. HKS 07]|uniref:ABC transporter ATP-binding protein n=1 Tax=Nordella sp. HKS 07 TaxID=2712222 RepID=UPI0013E15545|nr:ATP-binding cassette domain-containing protein [Nordella sp. HKS 07]QIG48505.1 ATP-binding cassette domain-containing protein [Nordella sp. HKS 07]